LHNTINSGAAQAALDRQTLATWGTQLFRTVTLFPRATKLVGLTAVVACLASSPLWAQNYVITSLAGGSPAPLSASATSMALSQLGHVATDPSGNVYFTALNSVFRMDSGGQAIRIAGNGQPGYSGDGGPALNAQLDNPQGLAIDTQGNIYIADSNNQVVRLVSNGTITTVAGDGTVGSGGDYGEATQAQLHLPTGVALDASGNLYIADSANNIVREVSGGIITPFAGNYIAGYSHDGDPASVAALNVPTDIAFDTSGNLYIADTLNGRIREVSGGTITTVAGGGVNYTEGGAATATLLYNPRGVTVDSSGTIYIADSDANRVRKVTKGVITTIAGAGAAPGFSGDGGPAVSAMLNNPTSVAVDASGNVFFVDLGNVRVRKVSSGMINTAAGNGTVRYAGDGGPAQSAQLNAASEVAVAGDGTVYIADTNNQRIRKIDSSGTISTVAGNGSAGYGGDNGAAGSAQLSFPFGVATDGAGNLYIADTSNQRVRKVSGGNISTVAGNGMQGDSGNGAAATGAELNSPVAVAVDSAGNLYIAEYSGNVVRKVSAATGVITAVAGNGSVGYSGDGGPATSAQLNGPSGLALDAAGDLYVADAGNHRVRRIGPDGTITTVAGDGTAGTSGDGGPAVNAELVLPTGLSTDGQGNLYIADAGASRVRLVTAGGLITTIAGTGAPGYFGDNGPATQAQLAGVTGVALDSAGNVYLADRGNNAIRLLQPVSSIPSTGVVVNSASNLTGPIAPGEAITIYGSGLGPETLSVAQPDQNGILPTEWAGTTVYIDGIAAPLLYTWTSQVAVVVPYGVTTGSGGVTVQYQGQIPVQLPVTVAATAPGVFTADGSGKGQALALNEDLSTNSASNPAPEAGAVWVYITGQGAVTPAVPDGSPNSAGYATPVLPVTATVGGQAAIVQFAGGRNGLSAGTIAVQIRIPGGLHGDAIPVTVQVGNASSQAAVTIAVQ
jgi:uncharacterized protein (TIGR03437 family)